MFTKKALIIRRTATLYYFLVNMQLEFEKYFDVYVNYNLEFTTCRKLLGKYITISPQFSLEDENTDGKYNEIGIS